MATPHRLPRSARSRPSRPDPTCPGRLADAVHGGSTCSGPPGRPVRIRAAASRPRLRTCRALDADHPVPTTLPYPPEQRSMPLRVVGDRLRQALSQCIDRRHGERVLRGIDPDRHFHAGPFLRPTYGGTPPMVDWRTTSRRWVPHRRDLLFRYVLSRCIPRSYQSCETGCEGGPCTRSPADRVAESERSCGPSCFQLSSRHRCRLHRRRRHLKRVGIIRTTPFVHTRISMRDGEGSAYVPRDHSLWLADDSPDAIFEVAPRTGRLKRVIAEQAFQSTDRFGGGPPAGAKPDR